MDLKKYPKYYVWKYVKRSISYKFAGFGLQLYYQGAPSLVFCQDKAYRSHSILRIYRATTFLNSFKWLLLCVSLTYLNERKTDAQQTVACFRSTIQKLDRLLNVYKVYNKDNRTRLIDVVLVSLLLTLNIFHTLLWCASNYRVFTCSKSTMNWLWAGKFPIVERFDNSCL